MRKIFGITYKQARIHFANQILRYESLYRNAKRGSLAAKGFLERRKNYQDLQDMLSSLITIRYDEKWEKRINRSLAQSFGPGAQLMLSKKEDE